MDINNLCPHCMREITGGRGDICPHCGKNPRMVAEVRHQLKPYTILQGKYLVGEVLGEGGFGITYMGLDINLEIRIAIKEFYPNGYATREANVTTKLTAYTGQSMDVVYKWRDNFLKEARSLAKCAHLPGVVGVRDFFQENNTAYIVQEYLEGQTIKEYAKARGGRIPAEQLFPAMEPVILALAEIHKEGLIHRDISPDNIMLLNNGQMKLLDFGAARDYTESGEKSLSVLLKPGYAPEEQYRTRGNQGPWTDIYALAGTIYKCITGITPPESMERMRQDELQRPSALGVAIAPQAEQALMKAMAVFAENRYQTVGEFHRDLYAKTPVGMAASTVGAAPVGMTAPRAVVASAQPMPAQGSMTPQGNMTPQGSAMPQGGMTPQGSAKGLQPAGLREAIAKVSKAVQGTVAALSGIAKKKVLPFLQKYKLYFLGALGGMAAVIVIIAAVFSLGRMLGDNSGTQTASKVQQAVTADAAQQSQETGEQPEEGSAAALLEASLYNEIFPIYGGADLSAQTMKYYFDGGVWDDAWTQTAGMLSYRIFDMDKDGCDELLVLCLDAQNIYLSVYEVEDDNVVKQAEAAEARSGDMVAYEEICSLIYADTGNYLLFTQKSSAVLGDGYYADMKLYQYDGSKLYTPLVIAQEGQASSEFIYWAYQYADTGELLNEEKICDWNIGYMDDTYFSTRMKDLFADYGISINDNQYVIYAETLGGLLSSAMNYEVLVKLFMWGDYLRDGNGDAYGAEYHFNEEKSNEEQSADYILPNSASAYLSEADLAGLTAEELRLARNEIYARHGRIFSDAALAAYFGEKSWYYPTVAEVLDTDLNEYEIANRDLIVSMENALQQ